MCLIRKFGPSLKALRLPNVSLSRIRTFHSSRASSWTLTQQSAVIGASAPPGSGRHLPPFPGTCLGSEADGEQGLCVRWYPCTSVSQLTISHPQLRQPYTSVVSWQLLLDSDIELLRAAQRRVNELKCWCKVSVRMTV